jgi:hypothetical protein
MTDLSDSNKPGPKLLTRKSAKAVEMSIITLCVAAMVMIFQPFSQTLFTIGAGLVVLGGLSFNLVPLCTPGRPVRSLVNAGLIVLAILLVVTAIAIGSAYLYGIYLTS